MYTQKNAKIALTGLHRYVINLLRGFYKCTLYMLYETTYSKFAAIT